GRLSRLDVEQGLPFPTGAEVVAVAGENDGLEPLVGPDLVEGAAETVDERVGEGVLVLPVLHGDQGDPVPGLAHGDHAIRRDRARPASRHIHSYCRWSSERRRSTSRPRPSMAPRAPGSRSRRSSTSRVPTATASSSFMSWRYSSTSFPGHGAPSKGGDGWCPG